ncbi:hypothetical protein C9374_011948 [Naegleria lovaniensis]|uniref:CS domain-containing protein n=1 Tax=Naegleria lovaniensis TaxID=51637 RepID=A0AA88GDV7_NAELO|nr:uncharacterized protein C9374_011948 [Naegleria lovaniensis]KAG2373659.1 hypothetical protein C9374_011948 [Naegleria lovaniensis]
MSEAATSSSHTPHVLWAPRSDRIYVTVEVPDATDVKVALQDEGRLKVSANSHGDHYELDLELFAEISTENSKWKVSGRTIDLNIERKDQGEFWPRLTKSNQKNRQISVDWTKWIDEEDDEEDQYDWHASGGDVNEPMNMEDFYLPQQETSFPENEPGEEGEEEPEEKPDLSDLDK